jgi:hypothetical protein
MSLPELVFLTVVLAIGLPSAVYNRTAAALVGSWGMQEAIYLMTGGTAEWLTGFALDYSVLLVIFTCSCRSAHDYAVAAIFPIMWGVHAMVPDPYYQWWALWWLALVQFVPAATGAVRNWRHPPEPTAEDGGIHLGNLFALLRRGFPA